MVDVMPSSVNDEYARIDLGAQFDDEDHVAASSAAIGQTIASTSVSVGKRFMSLLCCCWLLVDLKRRRRELCVITSSSSRHDLHADCHRGHSLLHAHHCHYHETSAIYWLSGNYPRHEHRCHLLHCLCLRLRLCHVRNLEIEKICCDDSNASLVLMLTT
jgi:hypothetical protein